MVLLQKKTILMQGSRGSTFFQGGGRGVQLLISIETHITCNFPGESGPPITPLDPHMVSSTDNSTSLHV